MSEDDRAVRGHGKKHVWACKCPLCRTLVFPVLKRIGVRSELSEEKEKELREILDALKDTLAELKVTLGDLSGPFSSLRKELSQPSMKDSSKPEPQAAVKPPSEGQEKTALRTEVLQQARAGAQVASLGMVLKALKILRSLREQMPGEIIEDELSLMKAVGLSEERQLEVLRQLNSLVDKSVKSGISLEDQVISIYILSKLLGISDDELEREFLDSVLERIKKKDEAKH